MDSVASSSTIRARTVGWVVGAGDYDKNVILASAGCNQWEDIFIPSWLRAMGQRSPESRPRTVFVTPRTNILIVEDDLTTQEMARMVLENAGYGVSIARSAEDAERMVQAQWPDIVLMDRDLPGMDGLELTRRLKVAQDTCGITVIAFSGRRSTEENEQALAAGSDGFINKPFTVRGLLQTVAWHVAARANGVGLPIAGARVAHGVGVDIERAALSARRQQDPSSPSTAFGALFMTRSRTAI